MDVIAVALSPLILVAEAPVLAAEGAVPFIGPWLVYKTIQAEINGIVNGIYPDSAEIRKTACESVPPGFLSSHDPPRLP